uniref:Putative ovule protein n=1 Tax=Solanum chacoense TaxID=4108 RepID=A0A0V0HBN2_SOLCH
MQNCSLVGYLLLFSSFGGSLGVVLSNFLFLFNFISNSYDSSSLEPDPLRNFQNLLLPHRKYSQNLEILGAIKNPSPHCSKGEKKIILETKEYQRFWEFLAQQFKIL